jgi:CheY-like chemotaxis protein
MSMNGERGNGAAIVLVAEDEGSLRGALVDALDRNGYGSVEAVDGDEVVLVARREKPDLILMDLVMPLLDGYAAARVLGRDPTTRDIPILAFNPPSEGNGANRKKRPFVPRTRRGFREDTRILERKTPSRPRGRERTEEVSVLAKKILVVDDEIILHILDFSLGAEGCEVITAADGEEALQKARTERPDLIVLDIMMPKVDGFEACRRLKADPETSPIPVILLTAKGREVDRQMGMEVGADDYIVKPFSPTRLIEKIGSYLSV